MLNINTTQKLLSASLLCLVTNSAVGALINEIEPNNPVIPFFIDSAFNIDPYFSSEFNPDIGDASGNNVSESSLHVSINGTGDGTYDYYSFTVANNSLTGIFDIDYGSVSGSSGRVDTEIALWNDKGTVLRSNDDFNPAAGAGGSTSALDSFIQYDFSVTGTYVIGVAKFNSFAGNTGWRGNPLSQLNTYTLNVALGSGFSTTPPPSSVPLPPALYLFLSGILSVFGFSRVTKKRA